VCDLKRYLQLMYRKTRHLEEDMETKEGNVAMEGSHGPGVQQGSLKSRKSETNPLRNLENDRIGIEMSHGGNLGCRTGYRVQQ